MCERHPHRKPRRIPPLADVDVRACSLDATFAGRRQGELNRYWENGVTLVCMPPEGSATVVNCRAKQVNGKFCIGYAGTIFSEDGVRRADQVGLVVGDAHAASHSPEICSVVEQVAKKLVPDYLVNLGDHMDSRSLNHHLLDRGEPVAEQIVSECGKGHEMLKMMAEWTRGRKHLVVGNHCRFIKDFARKMPQLESLLNVRTLSGAERLGYAITDEKGVLELAGAKFFHGDLKMFGASGDRHQRVHDVMESDTMFGHTHSPSCRLGCYTIGLLGQMDQDYNEVEASAWVPGFGTVATYGGQTFMCTIPVFGRTLRFMGSDMRPRNVRKWHLPEFVAEIVYSPASAKVSAVSSAK
jgi:predicted phosphodiesterase